MKARYFVLLFAFAAFLSQKALAGGIPLPTGLFSSTTTGSFAVCLNPTSFVEEACTTTGARAFPLTYLAVGTVIGNASGNACETAVQTVSDFPVDASAPEVTTNAHTVGKITHYDPSTGTGDATFTGYFGGSCHGALFDKTGATKVSSGTDHFVVSEDGKRIDIILTKLTDPLNGIGDFSLYGVNRR